MIDLELLEEEKPVELKLEENSKGGTKNYNDLDNKPTINGKTLQGNLTLEDLGIIVNAVKDILINGASIVNDGVANIPIASETVEGVAKIMKSHGIKMNTNNNALTIAFAEENNIRNRNSNYNPIVPTKLDYAVKCAMTDGKGAEWTPQEKANARMRMGLEWNLIDTVEASDVAQVEIIFPQEYNDFMIIADISGNGTSVIYPIGAYHLNETQLQGSTLPFVDFYPSDKDEHFELVFEKMNIENDAFLKLSGFESVGYVKKMKQNIQTTGWLQHYDSTGKYQCHVWHSVRFNRTITNATFKIYAR